MHPSEIDQAIARYHEMVAQGERNYMIRQALESERKQSLFDKALVSMGLWLVKWGKSLQAHHAQRNAETSFFGEYASHAVMVGPSSRSSSR